MPRLRAGTLTPLQRDLLMALADADQDEPLHGFALADRLRAGAEARSLIGHGTLYKALHRLLEEGLLTAVWEDPAVAEIARRPRRRLYAITAEGSAALARAAEPAYATPRTRLSGGLA